MSNNVKRSPYLSVFVGHPNVMFVSPVYWSKHTFFLREHTQFGGNWRWRVLKRSTNMAAVVCGISSIRLAIGIYARRYMYIDGSHFILFIPTVPVTAWSYGTSPKYCVTHITIYVF